MNIAVVGGGLAGLVAALRAHRDHDVTVFEREAKAGGKIRSHSAGGFLFEWGPNGFISSSPQIRDVIHACDLENEIISADAAARKRYVYFGGRLHALPSKPQEALRFSLLTGGGKLRALRGLFAAPPHAAGEESVYDFFMRRFGNQVAERAVSPALLGITAGDARTTSIDALFPRLRELERQHGSLLEALLRAPRTAGRLSTLHGGMTRLIEGLSRVLGTRVQYACEVSRIARNGSGWRVEHARGTNDFDAVVLAIPAYAAGRLARDVDVELPALLERIVYAPMRVAGIAFRSHDVPRPLDGFGFLAARDQGVRVLGAIYTSTLFPEQAPKNTVFLRVFLGGSADPNARGLTSDETLSTVRRDLATTLGVTAAPIAFEEHLWERAIPQYALGHITLLRQIDVRLASLPSFVLTGNAYRGVGIADVVRDAGAQVDRLLRGGNESRRS